MRNLFAILTLVSMTLAGEEPKKPEPPDRRAFAEAQKVSDPGKKIDALRKFIAEYPKSTSVNIANDLILQTLAKSFPDRNREIRDQADLILKNKTDKAAKYQEVADTLAENGVLLNRAHELAR